MVYYSVLVSFVSLGTLHPAVKLIIYTITLETAARGKKEVKPVPNQSCVIYNGTASPVLVSSLNGRHPRRPRRPPRSWTLPQEYLLHDRYPRLCPLLCFSPFRLRGINSKAPSFWRLRLNLDIDIETSSQSKA